MMTSIIRILLMVSMVAWLPVTGACGEHCGAEGDWKNVLIPDKWPTKQQRKLFPGVTGKLKTVPVYKACQKHDQCYDRKGADRDQCDLDFLNNIQTECERVYPGILETHLREACRVAAKGYYKSVQKYGQAAFLEAQGLQDVPQKTENPESRESQASESIEGTDETNSEPSGETIKLTENSTVFVKVTPFEMRYNKIVFEWNVFEGRINDRYYYLVSHPDIGTALIDITRSAMFDAETARELPGKDGMALEMNDLKQLDPSGAEQVVSQSSKRINAWWDKDTLSFTLGDTGLAADNEGPASLVAPASMNETTSDMPIHEPGVLFENSDFEMGDLTHWTADGNAFDFQPTKGDNPTARGRLSQPSNHQGDFWIGTFEKYQGKAKQKLGGRQGDRPKGTLTSIPFVITGDKIAFLVGGGKHKDREIVSLLVDGEAVLNATGKGNETLTPVVWDVSAYKGKEAQIIIKDAHTGGWGHINADDFHYPE